MRKELYNMLCDKLKEVGGGAIRHIDLWNNNVEFIEQEEPWERPAVFIEFMPIHWDSLVTAVEYRAEPVVCLHVVTDWQGSSAADSLHREQSLGAFDLLDQIHRALAGLEGETFADLDLVESRTNHNHDELIDNIESYRCVAIRSLR